MANGVLEALEEFKPTSVVGVELQEVNLGSVAPQILGVAVRFIVCYRIIQGLESRGVFGGSRCVDSMCRSGERCAHDISESTGDCFNTLVACFHLVSGSQDFLPALRFKGLTAITHPPTIPSPPLPPPSLPSFPPPARHATLSPPRPKMLDPASPYSPGGGYISNERQNAKKFVSLRVDLELATRDLRVGVGVKLSNLEKALLPTGNIRLLEVYFRANVSVRLEVRDEYPYVGSVSLACVVAAFVVVVLVPVLAFLVFC